MTNVIGFKKKSYCWATWRAREMAMAGSSAEDISVELGMHLMATSRVVAEYQDHEDKWQKALNK
jgi:hypothetical protein